MVVTGRVVCHQIDLQAVAISGRFWLHLTKNTPVGVVTTLVQPNPVQSVGFSCVPSSSSNQP